MKIVVLDGYTENPGDLSWQGLEQLGELTVYPRTSPEKILTRMQSADVVYTNKTPISREHIEKCPRLKFIGVLATGYNVVDVAAAKERNIPVCNIPTYGTTAVAQFAFALILELCHHAGEHSLSVMQGDWSSCPDFCYWKYPLIELRNKTLGIIGMGRIGCETAKIGAAFGMNVLYYDKHPRTDAETDAIHYASLSAIYQQADFISLHCPLFPDTEKMINAETIAKMKDGVFIINTSRGGLIDEPALAEALKSGKVAGAALDVVSSEPISPDNVLLGLRNCLITPHIAWAPKESRQRLMDIAVENLSSFLQGKTINVVNGVQ